MALKIKTKPKLVSIVIPNYFTGKSGKVIKDRDESSWFAEHCFKRIKKYTKIPYELVLIDNGSIVDKELLDKWADILIRNKENLGFAKGCNQGFKLARGDWICCMNNDVFVYEGWLEALIKTFEDNPDCGIAMPALMKQTRKAKEALRIKEIDLSQNYMAYGKGAEFGSCWLTKKEIMDKVGLFDENFKIGFGEDRDYWRRIRKAGYETYRTHKTRVFHQGNVTIGKIENRRKYTFANREYLKQKWGY
ncbi:MAG: glycosyltransferase family 2 protein [Candidatus Hodarchaeales archaeon]